tara:strand:- start:1427 stop:2098 length:672 start_codon:yes stop_codon:yes gene_type:complete
VRTIRSYVKRKGRITDGQNLAIKNLWSNYGVDFKKEILNLPSLFCNENPVHLEVGFGDGESLIKQAQLSPKNNYIGIEVHDPGIGHCLLQIENYNLSNIKIFSHDAIEVLEEQIGDASLERINIYFPDPWPKKKHHKRRIIQLAFLDLLYDKLFSKGLLCIATDWKNYKEHINFSIKKNGKFKPVQYHEHKGDKAIDRPTSKFEQRGLKKGHKIWDWQLQKNS